MNTFEATRNSTESLSLSETHHRVSPTRARDSRYDIGRCVAALLVVYVHYSVGFLPQIKTLDRATWLSADVMDSFGRVAVPLFLMMSGALVIGRPITDWRSYLSKRAQATLKPYFFGAVFYLTWQWYSQGIAPPSALDYAKSFVLGGAFFHLYFLFILLGMYIFNLLLQNIQQTQIGAVSAATAVLFALTIIERHIGPFGFSLGYLSLGTCYSYLPFFLSGYVLSKCRIPSLWVSFTLFFVSTGLTVALSWTTAFEGWLKANENFEQYTSLNVVLQSLAAFCIISNLDISNKTLSKAAFVIAELSLGIYVLHYAILIEIQQYLVPILSISVMEQIYSTPIICFIVTGSIVYLLHKVPLVKGFI